MYSRREPTQPQKVRMKVKTPTTMSITAGSTDRQARAASEGKKKKTGCGCERQRFINRLTQIWRLFPRHSILPHTVTGSVCSLCGGSFTCVLHHASVHSDRHHHQGDDLRREQNKKRDFLKCTETTDTTERAEEPFLCSYLSREWPHSPERSGLITGKMWRTLRDTCCAHRRKH